MLKKPNSLFVLIIELLLTLGISIIIIMNTIATVENEAGKYIEDVEYDYSNLTSKYVSVFSAVVIPVKEELKSDPSFAELDAWLKANDSQFKSAIGDDIYDGLALAYKGGYARSWSYGDYSGYDPATRGWYKEAKKANGRIAVVAPYVTYLAEKEGDISKSTSVEMSIV